MELLVVMAIMAIAVTSVSLSSRDGSEATLQIEGERLSALLESGRAQSRSTGRAWVWKPSTGGFSMGRANEMPAQTWVWLQPGMGVTWPTENQGGHLILGPEPIIAPQNVTLHWQSSAIRIATDGLGPFSVESAP